MAILEALNYCVHHQYTQVMLQTDSLLLMKVLEGLWTAPWNVAQLVEEINKVRQRCNVTISHILREGNSLADYLANYALDLGTIEAHSFIKPGTHGKRIVNNDKMQCPYLRVKPARN